jgi:hypothetical protein
VMWTAVTISKATPSNVAAALKMASDLMTTLGAWLRYFSKA